MKKQTYKIILIVALSACAVLASNRGWASSPSFGFSTSKNLSGTIFTLQGVGKKSVFFMDAFEVGYYQEKQQLSLNPLDDIAKHLEVRYFVNIPVKKLFNYNISVMEDNYSKEELFAIADEIAVMKEYYVDLKKGDSYELTYIPQIGTSFKYNGNLKGTIKGERFAEILFAVWLGEKPFDKKIKEQILSLRDINIDQKVSLLDS